LAIRTTAAECLARTICFAAEHGKHEAPSVIRSRGRGMLGSRRRIVEARRTETAHRWRGRSLLIGESGVALRRFSQTGRDLFPDPGALFSAKPISFQRSRIIRREFHEGVPTGLLGFYRPRPQRPQA